MRHVPHLLIPGPWTGPELALTADQVHHLTRVLRHIDGADVSYTDGGGTLGSGTLTAGTIRRGDESSVPRSAVRLTIAVAPPASKDRQRFLVEKCAELGVDRIVWLATEHSRQRPPAKAQQWADAGLEQSRGAWRTEVFTESSTLADLHRPVIVADASGERTPNIDVAQLTIAIGPEGGWSETEIHGYPTMSLGNRILRVETAAVVAAARFLTMRH